MSKDFGDESKLTWLRFEIPESSWNATVFEQVCRCFEELTGGETITWEVVTTGKILLETHYKKIKDRQKFFEKMVKKSGMKLQNSDTDHPLIFLPAMGWIGKDGQYLPRHGVMIMFKEPDDRVLKYLEAVAEILQATYCYYTPKAAFYILERALCRYFHERGTGDIALAQQLLAEAEGKLPHAPGACRPSDWPVMRPSRLGWLNYWSEETCDLFGFPAQGDLQQLAVAKRCGSGAWLIQLTETPLDLTLPEHRKKVIWGYQRFQFDMGIKTMELSF
ncbi:DUF5953 family protein [Methylovulum miyakonense]|uniref:DUF5953 family protein n=1 Tax=Methylovulum miyakonense TaxID=645578 RepID=UPI0003721BB1|nr:DUF5953 family protein [Methylovulum miyakonense]